VRKPPGQIHHRRRPSTIDTAEPVTEATQCSVDGGTLGTFVLAPSSSKGASVAVRIVSGVGQSPDNCVPPAYENCIVEHRELAFVPHTSLFLPILMSKDCVNVACGSSTTCVAGRCVSDDIPAPSRCTSPGACNEAVLTDGGVQPADSGMASQDGGTGHGDSGVGLFAEQGGLAALTERPDIGALALGQR
jgi:hypothetical protein